MLLKDQYLKHLTPSLELLVRMLMADIMFSIIKLMEKKTPCFLLIKLPQKLIYLEIILFIFTFFYHHRNLMVSNVPEVFSCKLFLD